jgi:hypothetical protein
VQNPSDSVVNRLALTKRLVSTLMCDDPETSGEQAYKEAVERPERNPGEAEQVRIGDVRRRDKRLKVLGCLENASNDN